MGAQLDEEFRDFMQHRWPAMVRLAYALTGDQGHAEDVAQAAFARAFASWPKIRRTGNPEAYVRRIVINENRNRFRKQRVPTLRHADAEHPVASYSATVRPPGPHSPPGLIASGTVKGQRWQIVAGRPGAGGAGRGQQIFLATGPALDSGSASTSVSTHRLEEHGSGLVPRPLVRTDPSARASRWPASW
jgi:hypothetical protein